MRWTRKFGHSARGKFLGVLFGDDFQVVGAAHDPDQGFLLHQIERDPALDVLPMGDDSFLGYNEGNHKSAHCCTC